MKRVKDDNCKSVNTECLSFWIPTIGYTTLVLASIVSDFIYVTTVPMYNDPIKGILIVTVTLPFFINFIYAIIEANNKDEAENVSWIS